MTEPRYRISKSSGGISSANDLPVIIAAATPLTLRVGRLELHEQIVDALIDYDVEVDLMPSNRAAIRRRRQEIALAAERLQNLLDDELTQELADLLRAYPATLAVLGQKPKGDLGNLPLHDLSRNLSALRTALATRVFEEGPRERSDRCPSFPGLVGALSEAFIASFQNEDGTAPETGSVFDRFARAALSAADIKPRNGGKFGDRAIIDALGSYRDWARVT
jgi:hypothetical protein